jgi:hypothetical protein
MTNEYKLEILDFIDKLKNKDVSSNVAAQVAAQLYSAEMKGFLPNSIVNYNTGTLPVCSYCGKTNCQGHTIC